MQQWIQNYMAAQHRALDSIPVDGMARLIETVREAWRQDRQIFAIGNGGNAANASHFATDLGKGSSDVVGRRFRVLSLTDNVAWLTALGNDYAYEDVFVRQLENFARPGDILLAGSVSGNSPNLVKAFTWASAHDLRTAALVGAKRGRLAEVAEQVIVIDDTHYGRVEDVQMHILHMVCYAIMGPQVFEKSLSCVNNLRLQEGRSVVRGHSIWVVDLQDGGGWDWSQGDPPKTNPAYYLRFCKSFSRMGGAMHYLQCDNLVFVHNLYHELGRS